MRGRVIESNKRVAPYRDAIHAQAIITAQRSGRIDSPCEIEAAFFVSRPASHYRKDGRLRKGAPVYPTSRRVGDIDKLARALHDGLTVDKEGFGLIADDSLIVTIRHRKRYVDGEACTHVTITTPTPEDYTP